MTFRIGKWEVHDDANTLVHGMETRRIDPDAMHMLVLLARHVGDVVTHQEISDWLWQAGGSGDQNLDVLIGDLRRALGDDRREPEYIEIIPRHGFRLIATVWGLTEAHSAAPAPKPQIIRPLRPIDPFTEHEASYDTHDDDPDRPPKASEALAAALGGRGLSSGGAAARPRPVLSAVETTPEPHQDGERAEPDAPPPPAFLMEKKEPVQAPPPPRRALSRTQDTPKKRRQPRPRQAPRAKKRQGGNSWLYIYMGVGLAVVAAVTLVLGLNFTLPESTEPQEQLAAIPISADRVVIGDVRNVTSDPNMTFAGLALSEMIASDLTPALGGRVMRWRDRSMAPARSAGLLKRILSGNMSGSMIDGEVVTTGGRPAVSMKLTDLATGTVQWSNRYPVDMNDLTGLAAGINRNLAQKLNTTANPSSWRAGDRGTFELYWRARYMWSLSDRKQHIQAVNILKDIVKQNPSFAPAHATLAEIYTHSSGTDLDIRWLNTFRHAEQHLRQAKAQDRNFPGLMVTEGMLRFYRDRDPQNALTLIDAGLKQNPVDPKAWRMRGMVLSAMGRNREALEAVERARALDPLSGGVLWDRTWFHYVAGDTNEAVKSAAIARRYAGPNYLYEALILEGKNDKKNALLSWVSQAQDRGLSDGAAGFVRTLVKRGQYADAYKAFCNWNNHDPQYSESALPLAIFYARSGDRDGLLELLRTVDPKQDRLWVWANIIPALSSVKTDRQAAALLARLSLKS